MLLTHFTEFPKESHPVRWNRRTGNRAGQVGSAVRGPGGEESERRKGEGKKGGRRGAEWKIIETECVQGKVIRREKGEKDKNWLENKGKL